MINEQMINPLSIVVVGGSNDITKPGGKVLKNLVDGNYKGKLYVANPKEDEVQNIKSYKNPKDLPEADLAILAIAAKYCSDTIKLLAKNKNTRAFIILSAGFSEESEEGAMIEKQIVETVNSVNGSLIGPNCIGVLNPNHHSVFTEPIPKLDPKGCDFISGSGATAVFILESGIPKGLTFSSVYSVGNSAQMGVEEVLKYMDENFDPENSSHIKLLYIETISKPQMLLKHARSLINKGCKIAAVKAGSSEAGSRAASSHTGAMASSDTAVNALFRKAGIVRCYGREDLISVASVFMHPPLKGKNIAIITHAGGPAVMLTDALSNGGLEIPKIKGQQADALLDQLFPGSSVSNPIDFLATGTDEQLGTIIDFVENKFTHIDGMAVIFGTPGLFPVYKIYDVLHDKMNTCKKPIYPVLPSVTQAADEIRDFLSKNRVNFPDEVILGKALAKVFNTPAPANIPADDHSIDHKKIRTIIDQADKGYISPEEIQDLLDAAGLARAGEAVVKTAHKAKEAANKLGYPVVMKVIGPVHKSDVGGVSLDVNTDTKVEREFNRLITIKDTTAVLMQPMLKGIELFIGAKHEPKFGHMILCGLGGIFVEVLKDVNAGLVPVNKSESIEMIQNLKSYKIIQGVRGQEGVNEDLFAEVIGKLSGLLQAAPEIVELDLNPLLGNLKQVVAVDARIRIEK